MTYYAPISRRLKALIIDGILLSIWFFLAITSIKILGLTNSEHEAILILFIVASIEPLLISLTGSSVGQHLCGIMVRSSRSGRKLNIFSSYLRYFVKLPLGIFSLLTVATTIHRQAMHDLLGRCIVVHKDSNSAPFGERLSPRLKPNDDYKYPSVLRRVSVIFLYLLLSFIALIVISAVGISETCLNYGACSQIESAINFIVGSLFYIATFVFVALGWQSKLRGCRKCLIKMTV